jgi:hypothetical protein
LRKEIRGRLEFTVIDLTPTFTVAVLFVSSTLSRFLRVFVFALKRAALNLLLRTVVQL